MANDYSYLSGLSPEAQKVIIDKVERGEPNLYHSIMAVLGNRRQRECLKDFETEKKHYRKYSKRNTNISDISDTIYNEIFNYVYASFISKGHTDIKRPLTSKDNMLIAKGAMIIALEKCNVSDKNIKGMIGVLDHVLRNNSEYRLKAAYKDYIRENQEQNE